MTADENTIAAPTPIAQKSTVPMMSPCAGAISLDAHEVAFGGVACFVCARLC